MGTITVVGTGCDPAQLTLGALQALREGDVRLLRTEACGCAEWLRSQGLAYATLDLLYEQCEDFDVLTAQVAGRVLEAAAQGDVVYAVLDLRDRSVPRLLRQKDCPVRLLPGPCAEQAIAAEADGPVLTLAAADWERFALTSATAAVVREIDTRELAAEVKLKLMEVYPEESEISVLQPDGTVAHTRLYQLDRLPAYDHRTCAFVDAVEDVTRLERYDFVRLCQIIHRLMAPGGCPWDRAQTHETLRPYLIEEAYEVIDAINAGDTEHLYDELGDVLLQILLHAELGVRHGEFDLQDVITAISRKMIQRHSHVFGADSAEDPDKVLTLWEKNKMAERGEHTRTEALRDVSRAMPALLRARKLIRKASKALGLERTAAEAAQRLRARLSETEAFDEAKLGEVLLTAVELSEAAGIDPELALTRAADSMVERFGAFEREILEEGSTLDAQTAERLREGQERVLR